MQTASRRWSAILLICSLFMAVSLNSNATDPADDYAEIRAAISQLIPGLNGMEIQPSAIENMLEVRADTNVFYVSSDGGFLLNGPLRDLERGENLTEKRLAEYRKILLKDIPAIQPVEYPTDNAKQKIIVITDVDCAYCRRLHQDLDKYHQAGLDIDYVMLPRSGKDSPSYVKTVNAICAAQPDVAITAAMNGETPASAECDHPIDQHMEMARALGAASTPNIVLPDGTLIRGYTTAAELSRLLVASSQD
jgi:thiol:disulfide interchange protein DsbC